VKKDRFKGVKAADLITKEYEKESKERREPYARTQASSAKLRGEREDFMCQKEEIAKGGAFQWRARSKERGGGM